MYNQDLPKITELPSSKQLIRSSIISVAVASVLLITTVLPAEYGIDPTGIGGMLGLTKMGEIKVALEKEATQEAIVTNDVTENTTENVTSNIKIEVEQIIEPAVMPIVEPLQVEVATVITELKSKPQSKHSRSFELKNGAAAEIKLAMNQNAIVKYSWSTDGGNVNFDTHGDGASTNYFGYGKGRNKISDAGTLTAAFDGSHGWYWRNRSGVTVTITLNTQGDYQSIKRVL